MGAINFNVSDQISGLTELDLDSAEQIFATGTTVKSPENAAGSILNAMLDPGKYEKATPTGLEEEIKELGNVGAFLFVKQDSGDLIYKMTNQFYLQAMEVSSKERAQISNTFGASSVFLFGESAKIYSFSGTAVDYGSQNIQGEYFQGSALLDLYNKELRGTQLVDNKRIAVLKVLNHTIWGYPLNFTYRKVAHKEKTIEFGMSWVIVDHTLTASSVVVNDDLEYNSSVEKYLSKLGETSAQLIKSSSEILTLIYGIMENVEKVMAKRTVLSSGDLDGLKAGIISDFVTPLKEKLEGYKDTITETKLIKNSHVSNFEDYFSRLNININAIKPEEVATVWFESEEWSSLVYFYKFVFTQKQKLMSGSKI
jgi:hypothetical protein